MHSVASLPWADGRTRPLSRRKGLSNECGENNCFLNVIIQSLWHVRSCRVLISTGDHAVHHRCGGDIARAGQHEAEHATAAAETCLLCELEQIFIMYEYSEEPVLDVDRVRVALSDVFALGDMNDATETLEAILDALHWDTLHRMLTIRHGSSATPMARDALSQSMQSDASAIVCEPMCIAHVVFQMNLMELPTCGACGATAEPVMNTDFLYRVYAQELLAHAATSGRTLEDVLRLEAQGDGAASSSDYRPTCGACQAKSMQTGRWILTLPMVFCVSVIWASDRVNKTDVKAWMDLLSTQSSSNGPNDQTLRLGRIFHLDSTAAAASDYAFRGMVCYYGRHYVGFFASRAAVNGIVQERWYLFDDTRVKCIGAWSDVRLRVERGGYQPTLLFYERNGLEQSKLEAVATEIHTWWKATADTSDATASTLSTDSEATTVSTVEPTAVATTAPDSKMELLAAMRESLRIRPPPPTSSAMPTSPIHATPAVNAVGVSTNNWHDDELHRLHKSAEDTLSRLNGMLSLSNDKGRKLPPRSTPLAVASTDTAAAAAADLRRTMSMSMRRSMRKRDYSFRSTGVNAPVVNRDEIFNDLVSAVTTADSLLSKQPPLSPIQQGIPEVMYGFDARKRSTSQQQQVAAAQYDQAAQTSAMQQQLPTSSQSASPVDASNSSSPLPSQSNTTEPNHAPFREFHIQLRASDGGVGLVLEAASASQSALAHCAHAFVVAGFEVNGAGNQLAAEASGEIAIGDVLVAINGHVLTHESLVDVLELLWLSPNPVALVFRRFQRWVCSKCTLENAGGVVTCNACGHTVEPRDATGASASA